MKDKGSFCRVRLLAWAVVWAALPLVANLPDNYEQLSAAEKQRILLGEIKDQQWEELPPLSGEGWKSLSKSLKAAINLRATFRNTGDEFREEKPKLIHAYGVTAAFRMESVSPKYSGLFENGGRGILRLSLAADPRAIPFTPGVSLKFLIDGKESQNLMAMNDLEGQGEDTNWFARPFSNEIPKPTTRLMRTLLWIFSWVQNPPNVLSIRHLASIDTKGTEVDPENVVVPQQIFFEPPEEVKALISPESKNDFRNDLMDKIKANTTIYRVMAKDDEHHPLEHIGNIILESDFFASRYADKRLFFKHHR